MIRFVLGLFLVFGAVGNMDTNADIAWYVTLAVLLSGFGLMFWSIPAVKSRFN